MSAVRTISLNSVALGRMAYVSSSTVGSPVWPFSFDGAFSMIQCTGTDLAGKKRKAYKFYVMIYDFSNLVKGERLGCKSEKCINLTGQSLHGLFQYLTKCDKYNVQVLVFNRAETKLKYYFVKKKKIVIKKEILHKTVMIILNTELSNMISMHRNLIS